MILKENYDIIRTRQNATYISYTHNCTHNIFAVLRRMLHQGKGLLLRITVRGFIADYGNTMQ